MSVSGSSQSVTSSIGEESRTKKVQLYSKSLKRIEKYNDRLNVISVVLILLALATIPVTYFSLNASRSGDYLVKPDTSIIDTFIVYFQSTNVYVWNKDTTVTPLKEHKILKLFVNVTTNEDSLTYYYELDTSIGIFPQLFFVFGKSARTKYTEVAPVKNAECNQTFSLYDRHHIGVCVPNFDYQRPGSTVNFYIGFLDERYFLVGPTTLSAFYSYPKGLFARGTNYCEKAFCFPTYDFQITQHVDDNGGVDINSQSGIIQTNLHAVQPFVIPFATQPVEKQFQQVTYLLGNGYTLQSTLFTETKKYSTTDTAIDSFAISGLILAAMLLIVLFSKMLIWFIFSPRRQRR